MTQTPTFTELGIPSDLTEKLVSHEITTPTAVQAQLLPVIADGTSVLFRSETGTGKTLAYLLPLIANIIGQENVRREIRIIIAAPTYELASQIKTQVQLISTVKTALLIGGAPIKRQIELLKEKPAIVVGGPARLLELYHLRKLKLEGAQALVLDEVDRLFAPEQRDDTTTLLKIMNKNAQLIGCSATINEHMVQQIESLSGKVLSTMFLPQEDILRKRITHMALYAEQRDKIETLRRLLSAEKPEKALIFTSRTDQVANIVSKLMYHKINCAGLHARADKTDRKAAIDHFRNGKCPILVTSDLASRGLDISGISHVIQMDLPSNDDFFIHRAGRTARAGKTGINIVIGDEHEMIKYAALEKKLGLIVYPKMLYNGKLITPPDDNEKNENLSQ